MCPLEEYKKCVSDGTNSYPIRGVPRGHPCCQEAVVGRENYDRRDQTCYPVHSYSQKCKRATSHHTTAKETGLSSASIFDKEDAPQCGLSPLFDQRTSGKSTARILNVQVEFLCMLQYTHSIFPVARKQNDRFTTTLLTRQFR